MDSEASLLFKLRSTSLSLSDKLLLAQDAPRPSAIVRDWIVDLLLRSRKQGDVLLEGAWWALLAEHEDPAKLSSASILPALTAFASQALENSASEQAAQAVNKAFAVYGSTAMRRANVDAAMDCHAAFIRLGAAQAKRDTSPHLAQLVATVENGFLKVAEAGKGSKKVLWLLCCRSL